MLLICWCEVYSVYVNARLMLCGTFQGSGFYVNGGTNQSVCILITSNTGMYHRSPKTTWKKYEVLQKMAKWRTSSMIHNVIGFDLLTCIIILYPNV